MHWFYYGGRVLTRVTLFLFTRYRVTGAENVPREGPLLVIANHLSVADPPVLGTTIKRKMIFMAKEELFRSPFTAYFIRGFGAFPVHRDRVDRTAQTQAERCLNEGMTLLMFPEGRRSVNLKLQEGLPGAALLACRCDVPVVPVAITGTEHVRGKTWWLRRPRITVNFGKPFRLPQNGRVKREELSRLTGIMMKRIAEVLPPSYGGTGGDSGDRESQ